MTPCNNSSFQDHSRYAFISPLTLSIVGLPGNALVIILILRAKQKKSTTTCLLMSLAIADILNLLGVDAAVISALLVDKQRHEKATLLLYTVPPKLVANFILALIALERYNAFVKTMDTFMNLTQRKIVVFDVVAWGIGFAVSVLLFLVTLHHDSCLAHDWPFDVLSALVLLIGFVAPLVIVLFCYWSIIKGLYIDRTILGQKVTCEASLNEKKRLVRILVVMSLVFLTCNVNSIIVLVLHHQHGRVGKIKGSFMTVVLLGCFSSSINPYLYALQSENYRNQIKALFCKTRRDQLGLSLNVFDTQV